MQTTRWFRSLAIAVLFTPIAGRAQGPQPKITQIATIPGVDVNEVVRMPNGRVIVYSVGDSILAYDLTTKRSALITRGYGGWDLTISPRGDRIAYQRRTEDGKASLVWAIAIDPATGATTGPAQRVDTSTGDCPAFSPDGKLIAFLADRGTPRQGQNLVVVPATGGAQRVLAEFTWSAKLKALFSPSWSPDGKWIYLHTADDSVASVERVPAAGGKREVIFSYPRNGQHESGFDGQVAFWEMSWLGDRMGYQTADGARGEFEIPSTARFGRWSGPPRVLRSTTRPYQPHVLNLVNGTVRDLPVERERTFRPLWSPDGNHLAFESVPAYQPVAVNADGSGRHSYSTTARAVLTLWSPDGAGLLYMNDNNRVLQMLDVATGNSRVLATAAPQNSFLPYPKWQPDGKSVLVLQYARSKEGAFSNWVVFEIRLDGTKRMVRDLSAEHPSMRGAMLTSNRLAVVEIGDSAGRWSLSGPNKIFMVPLDGGAARPVALPSLEPGVQLGWVTGWYEKWLITSLYRDKELVGFAAMSTGMDATRVIRFPAGEYQKEFVPLLSDNEHLINFRRSRGDKDVTVYSIPLDGSAPRAVARIPDPRALDGGSWEGSGLSADGKFFAYFSAGAPTSHIYDVDLTPILQLVKKP